MARRKNKSYFKTEADAPAPITVSVKSRVRFSDVDPMGVAWHGRYPLYFEEGFAALGRLCGLSYTDFFHAKLMAPIVELHIDYFESLYLDEEFTIQASLVWHEGARINIEYRLIKANGALACSGYTVELLVERNGEPCMASPPLLNECRRRWKNGEFH